MPNIAYVMNTHNKKVLIYPTKPEKKFCHCIGKARYPLNEKCFRNNILYQEAISSAEKSGRSKIYYEIAETTFEIRYANHCIYFNHKNINMIKNIQRNIGE